MIKKNKNKKLSLLLIKEFPCTNIVLCNRERDGERGEASIFLLQGSSVDLQ
jgi:hypothetical protein